MSAVETGSISQGADSSAAPLLLGRYRISRDKKVGQGTFSEVFLARDEKMNKDVAVKTFLKPRSNHEKQAQLERFRHQIDVANLILDPGNNLSRRGSGQVCPPLLSSLSYRISPLRNLSSEEQLMGARDLVVNILDFSVDAEGKPAAWTDGNFYIVLELGKKKKPPFEERKCIGSYTLEELVEYRANNEDTFNMNELRSLFWDICRMVAVLHRKQLVHMDIKPANIMRFDDPSVPEGGRWKLIDLDGVIRAASVMEASQCDAAFTPLYASPELAKTLINPKVPFRVSRLMDVWSVGMTVCDLIFLQPFLEPTFEEMFNEETMDDSNFLKWLADDNEKVEIPEELQEMNSDLYDLLQNCILVKDFSKRHSLPEILTHKFFQEQGEEAASTPDPAEVKETASRQVSCVSSNSPRVSEVPPVNECSPGVVGHAGSGSVTSGQAERVISPRTHTSATTTRAIPFASLNMNLDENFEDELDLPLPALPTQLSNMSHASMCRGVPNNLEGIKKQADLQVVQPERKFTFDPESTAEGVKDGHRGKQR